MCALVFMTGVSFSFLCDPMQSAVTEKQRHTWGVCLCVHNMHTHTHSDAAVNPVLKCDDNVGVDDGEGRRRLCNSREYVTF